jgi:hypothetical protein
MAVALGTLLTFASVGAASAATDYLQGRATISRYMATVDPTVTHREGCDMARGVDDQATSGIVVLDWGEPYSKGASQGTSMFGASHPFVTIAQIQAAAQGYLDGYASCNRSATDALTLAIGTTNYGKHVTTAHAAAWAAMVRALTAYVAAKNYTNETVAAADDMETSWADPLTTRAWLDTFVAAAGSIALYDYGDADGCSRTSFDATDHCWHFPWTQADVAYVEGGAGPHVYALPEIYAVNAASSKQFAWIGVGAAEALKPLTYAAVMTQVGSCGDQCKGYDLTPLQALAQFNAELGLHPETTSNEVELATDISSAN